ncbi:MAG: hypothetical protein D6705_17750 [Deltaproteobacteria bacterium]|nr:MAG: hypothetical protein D6705_17750 [Deltaproteobacteria bacterium]
MLHLDRISSLGEALRDTTVTFKSKTALIEADRHRENGRWTYGDLRRDAERFAARLLHRGLESGDKVAICMQNQARWLVAATGAFWAGAVVVPIDYKLTAPEQARLVEHSEARFLVAEPHTLRQLADAGLALGEIGAFSVGPAEAAPAEAIPWDDHAEEGTFRFVPRGRDDVACIVYSSGTGGTPKGCMLTHGNYLAQAQVLSEVFDFDEGARFFSVLPTNHAIDFMAGYVLSFLLGSTVIHQRTLRPQYLASTMKRYEVTHIALVPTILKNIEKRLRERIDGLTGLARLAFDAALRANEAATLAKPRPKLSRALLKPIHDEFGGHLEVIFAGGTFVDPKMASYFYSLGLPVAIGYGLTEAGTVVAVNDLKPFRPDTVGRPVPGTEIEIRNPAADGVGEVWVRGPTVMKGYFKEPELTAETIVDGWLRTGDLGYIDASGHLHLVGRAKNMIVTEGGKNVYPEDIEAHFEDVPDCEEICVFARNYVWPKRTLTGETLVAVLRPTKDASVERIAEALAARNRRLPDFKRLAGFVPTDEEFPRTASMKVKRNLLADRLRSLDPDDAIRPL